MYTSAPRGIVCHLIHGIHDVGVTPIEKLIPYLAPYAVAYPDYGYILGVESREINPAIVGTMRPYVQQNDILIGHSNGCAIAYDLMNTGVKVAGAIFINAALTQDIKLPVECPWIDVYFNEGDEITEAAKVAAKLGIVDPVYGECGHAGYSGRDPAIRNFDCAHTPSMPICSGHSDFFNHLEAWGPFLANRIQIQLALDQS
jgi:hypothetical protein